MTDTDTVLDVGLDDWLAAPVSEPDWEPDDQAGADKLLGALRGIQRQLDEDAELVRERKAELHAWQASRADVLERRRADVERLLEGWCRMRYRASGERETTWKLPNGELKLRKAQPKVLVQADDEDALARRLEAGGMGDLVITKRTVSKDAVKKAGEAGPEVTYEGCPPGYTAHAVVRPEDGVLIEGAVLLVPTEKSFTAKPAPSFVPRLVRADG